MARGTVLLAVVMLVGCSDANEKSNEASPPIVRHVENNAGGLEKYLGKSEEEMREVLGAPDEILVRDNTLPSSNPTREEILEWRRTTIQLLLVYGDYVIDINLNGVAFAIRKKDS